MINITSDEIRGLRTKAYQFRACDEPEEHKWGLWAESGFAILIICVICGRTPVEMLSELKIVV